jgi:hypothetical protein
LGWSETTVKLSRVGGGRLHQRWVFDVNLSKCTPQCPFDILYEIQKDSQKVFAGISIFVKIKYLSFSAV